MEKIFAPLQAALLALANSAEVYAVRQVDAGYDEAIEFAKKNNVNVPIR